MKRFLNRFVICIFLLCVFYSCRADDYYLTSNETVLNHDNNIVAHDMIVNNYGDTITVQTAAILTNYGVINGDLNTNGYNLRIRNSGRMDGNILACPDRICVHQIISSLDELTKLNITNGNFEVDVQNVLEGVNLKTLQNLMAARYVFDNSVVIIDDFSWWQHWDADVEWNSGKLYITNSYTVNSGDVIKNVSREDIVEVKFLDEDKLHKPLWDLSDAGMVLYVVRETDYEKIFSDNRGVMLANIRRRNPNDKLLKAMDAANNMHELRRVMRSSARFNSDILMQPINVINNFALLEFLSGENYNTFGIKPTYIISDDLNDYGGQLYVNAAINDDWRVGLGLNINKFNYENNVNEFAGLAYGANINANAKFGDFTLAGQVGFNLIKFDIDYVYVDNKIQSKPGGYSLYGGIDGLYNYKIINDLCLTPFVGGVFQKYNVLNFSDNDVNLRAGVGAKYGFSVDSIKYEYGAFGGVISDGNVFGNLKIGFASLPDRAGVTIDVGVYKNNDILNYRASIDAKVMF